MGLEPLECHSNLAILNMLLHEMCSGSLGVVSTVSIDNVINSNYISLSFCTNPRPNPTSFMLDYKSMDTWKEFHIADYPGFEGINEKTTYI